MDDAGRVTAGYEALTDDELIAQNAVGAYVGIDTLKIVTVSEEKGCVLCGNGIAPGPAVAAPTIHADRCPDAVT
jgi:hypothetical protein